MKRWIIFYRALQILCDLIMLMLLVYAGALCVRMSGGYLSGWSAGYCLPRIFAAGAGILGLEWAHKKYGEWVEIEKEYARSCRKNLLYGGYLSTQYADRDGRNSGNGGAA